MLLRLFKRKYEACVPPFEKHPFHMNEQETKAYFDWFQAQVPLRTAYVARICASELGVPAEKLDCSPESLLLLWKCFRCRAKTERLPRKERLERRNRSPRELWQDQRQLTVETEHILRDIGMYLGETFCRNHDSIYWTYYTQPNRDFFVNHPLLKGFVDRSFEKPFAASFEPVHMAHVQAAKILTGKSRDEDLYNLYLWWAERA